MAGVGFDSADLLQRMNAYAGRPTADSISDAAKYQCLADGQNEVIMEIANVAQNSLVGAPVAMTTADGGYTWTFGTDGDGYALFPLGKAQIYPTLTAVPDYPWIPGIDYLDEGTQIRLPNNQQWPGPLYWRGMTSPPAISATNQPVIQPPLSRILIVIKGVRIFAEQFARNPVLAATMEARWQREWPKHATAIRRHFRGARTLGPLTSAGGAWGPSLGFGFGAGGWGP